MKTVAKRHVAPTVIAAIATCAFCLLALAAMAQPQQNFDKEWNALVAAAKKEGKVSIASGGEPSREYRPLLGVFRKKFGIDVEMSTGGANSTASRVLAERKEGRKLVDVALISLRIHNLRLVPAHALLPMAPLLIRPDVLDTAKWYGGKHWYGDKERKFTFIYAVSVENTYDSWYNTDEISESEIKTIKSEQDFFDPRWKGKIEGQAMDDPSGIRQMIDGWYEPDRGEGWVKKYLLDRDITFSGDRRVLENWLVGGRFPLWAVTSNATDLLNLSKKGIHIKMYSLPKQSPNLRAEGSGCCVSVFEGAPHPNAAKLFVNWFLSKEGQTLLQTTIPNIDRASLRNDVPPGHVVKDQLRQPGRKYSFPDADPDSGARYKEAQEAIMKVWASRQK
jgi:iron(III) transport system substrate-binding protein